MLNNFHRRTEIFTLLLVAVDYYCSSSARAVMTVGNDEVAVVSTILFDLLHEYMVA